VRDIMPRIAKPITTYGLNEGADIRAVDITHSGGQMRFGVINGGGRRVMEVTLNLPGLHNVLNALAAIAIGLEVGATEAAIVKALAEFRGVGRRFTRYGEVEIADGGQFTLVDDYGHHPVEMAATLAAARAAFPGRRLVLAFQPHRYTRTRDLFEDFVKILSSVDVLLLNEVYAAGETPIVAADGRALARAVRISGKLEPHFVEHIAELPRVVLDTVQDGDVVLCMGAGSIGQSAAQIVEAAHAPD
jgi:UDP-N-acetylmuramate--alanine ligase